MSPLPDDKLPEGAGPDEARAYLFAHDARVLRVDAMSDRQLRLLYNAALNLRGMTCLLGGPSDHDGLVNNIVDLEFPDAQKARDIWYRHVQMPAIGQELEGGMMRRKTTTDAVQRHLDAYPYKPRDDEFNALLVGHMRDEHVDAWARWMVGDTIGDIEDQHYMEHGRLGGEAEMRREIALDASVARHPAGKKIGQQP